MTNKLSCNLFSEAANSDSNIEKMFFGGGFPGGMPGGFPGGMPGGGRSRGVSLIFRWCSRFDRCPFVDN